MKHISPIKIYESNDDSNPIINNVYHSESSGKDFYVYKVDDGSVYINTFNKPKSIANQDIMSLKDFNRYVRDGIFVYKHTIGDKLDE